MFACAVLYCISVMQKLKIVIRINILFDIIWINF